MRNAKRFVAFAWFNVAYNVGVILSGAYVRATGSGAGCGDHWPLCDDQVLPAFTRPHIAIEFTHRVLSGFVLVFALSLGVWAFRLFPRGHKVRVALWWTVGLVVFEALLGAGLVKFGLVAQNSSLLRAGVMAMHLISTFLLVGFLALTAAWASGWGIVSLRQNKNRGLIVIGFLFVGVSGAVTALGDTLFKPAYVGQYYAGQHILSETFGGDHFLKSLRVYHPLLAIVMGVCLLALVGRWMRFTQTQGVLQKRLAIGVGIVIYIQLACGFVNVLLKAPVWLQIVHLFLALVLWTLTVLACFTGQRGAIQG
jgi:heme a synthase